MVRVFCLVRAKDDKEARSRVSTSLRSRKRRALESDDKSVICLASDLSQPDLRLSNDELSRIMGSTSILIHVSSSTINTERNGL